MLLLTAALCALQFHSVRFEGVSVFPADTLRRLVTAAADSAADSTRLEQDLQRVGAFYRLRGYAIARVDTAFLRADTLVIHVAEGRIMKLAVAGNHRVKTRHILAQFGLRVGEIYYEPRARAGRDRLLRSGFFDAVEVAVAPAPDSGAVVTLEVYEKLNYGSGGRFFASRAELDLALNFVDYVGWAARRTESAIRFERCRDTNWVAATSQAWDPWGYVRLDIGYRYRAANLFDAVLAVPRRIGDWEVAPALAGRAGSAPGRLAGGPSIAAALRPDDWHPGREARVAAAVLVDPDRRVSSQARLDAVMPWYLADQSRLLVTVQAGIQSGPAHPLERFVLASTADQLAIVPWTRTGRRLVSGELAFEQALLGDWLWLRPAFRVGDAFDTRPDWHHCAVVEAGVGHFGVRLGVGIGIGLFRGDYRPVVFLALRQEPSRL